MKAIAFLIGSITGVLIVRAYLLDTIQLLGWRFFWSDLSNGNFENVDAVLRSQTFLKCVIGFLAGGALGILTINFVQQRAKTANETVTAKQLRIAGWFSVAMAILELPTNLISLFVGSIAALGIMSEEASRWAFFLLTLLFVYLFIFVYHALRVLLESRYSFYAASGPIRALMLISVIVLGATWFNIKIPELDTPVIIMSWLSIFICGILFVVLAIKLLQVQDSLSGMLKPYSYTAMAAGICYASILLIPLGILIGIANGIILALLFFKEADRCKPNSIQPTGDTRVGHTHG